MVWWPRQRRFTTKPTRTEVNVRAIPLLPPGGWRIYTLEEIPLVGAVPKNYLAYGNPQRSTTLGYIAKRGRMNADARECVTEEIISKIGAMLPVKMARSKLVRISKSDVRFLSQNFVVRGKFELLHGIELAAQYFQVGMDEVESAFDLRDSGNERNFYTVDNILAILKSRYPDAFLVLREGFCRMLAFDAFIGAPDRHAMNWGVLAPLHPDSGSVRFAPIFDTARGLFREYSDSDLIRRARRMGRQRFLENYANHSRPIISTGQTQPDNHFTLVRWISINHPLSCRSMLSQVFSAVHIPSIERMLQLRFRRIITQERIEFIRDLLEHRIQRLREEVRV